MDDGLLVEFASVVDALRCASEVQVALGGICVSARVQEDAAGRLDLTFDDIGEQQLKNISRPVHVYRLRIGRLLAVLSAPRWHCLTSRRLRYYPSPI